MLKNVTKKIKLFQYVKYIQNLIKIVKFSN